MCDKAVEGIIPHAVVSDQEKSRGMQFGDHSYRHAIHDCSRSGPNDGEKRLSWISSLHCSSVNLRCFPLSMRIE